MNLIDHAAADTLRRKKESVFLRRACVLFDEDCDLRSATYFEIRPIFDGGEFSWTSYLYGDGTSHIQIRMGVANQPSKLLAKYSFDKARTALEDFFNLSELLVPLWYNGNDAFARVTDLSDLVLQISVDRFSTSDIEFAELLANTGLSKAEQAIVRAKMEE